MKGKSTDLLTAQDAAQLLNINEKKVYALAQEGKIPGTKVTGKWIFPRVELENYLRSKSQQTIRRSFFESVINKKVILVCGSDDPVLCMAQGCFHKEYPDYTLFSSSVGSGEGLRLLSEGFCHVAVCHLYDPDTEDFNFPFLHSYFEYPDALTIVNLFYRCIGFVAKDHEVTSFADFVGRNLQFINRQKESGIRALVDHLIDTEGVQASDIKGFEDEAFTHLDVINRISSGRADVGIVTELVARSSNLPFHKILEERFDMVVRKEIFFDRSIQAFVEFLKSRYYRDLLKEMEGYDYRDAGKIIYAKKING
ncbi:MAG TPA: helix-turn-helix transcriptional regulator [Syntrophales bacterium]|nr:helix-turn-helix transcriptional regulator [Syntrophales bacterium]HPQ43505.1 helix-turn-helix transcriptional regulator [Syntrophales bacterium]